LDFVLFSAFEERTQVVAEADHQLCDRLGVSKVCEADV